MCEVLTRDNVMKSRALSAVLLCLRISLIVVDSSTADDEPVTSVTNSPNADEHSKLLLECQHPDYRTYIKCLKRQKRHHYHNGHDSEGGDSRNKCFEECGMNQCETSKCVHDCHHHCMKKTKETRQIITQYETTCDSDDCKDENKSVDLPATNITTNIDINNVINNHMPKNEVVDNPTGPNKPSGPNNCVGNVPYCCGGTRCSGGGGWYGSNPGLTLVPQIQLVPQITFGLGAGAFAGGGYWQHGLNGGVDCSQCANPFLRYRCDVSCYTSQDTGQTGGVDCSHCANPSSRHRCDDSCYAGRGQVIQNV